MANLTIKEQPGTFVLGKSPLLYSIISTDYTENDFEYVIDVYLWQGATTPIPGTYSYRLRKPRNATTGATTVDISSLISEYFLEIPDSFSSPDDVDEMTVNVSVSFGYTYTDGTGTGQEEFDVSTSSTIKVLYGYSKYSEGINFQPTTYSGYYSGSKWLTDKPLVNYIHKDTDFTMSVVKYGSVMAKVKYVINGSETVYKDLTAYDDGLLMIGMGIPSLPTHTTADDDIVKITACTVTSTNIELSQTYTFYIDQFCKYGYTNFRYINRFGVWDNFFFTGSQVDSYMVDKEEKMNSPLSLDASSEFYLDSNKGQYQHHIVNGRESFSLNTGWIDEGWNEPLRQMMTSEKVYDYDNSDPVVVDTKNIQLKSNLIDKLINYTVNFKKAYTFINTVN